MGDLASEFTSSAALQSANKELSAEFGRASQANPDDLFTAEQHQNDEFQLNQKAHIVENGGSTNDARVMRYADLMGVGSQAQTNRKDKDDQTLRQNIALRAQAEMRDRLEGMRAGLMAQLDQRLSALQNQLLQQQADNQRLRGIHQELKESRSWPLGKDDTEFLHMKAGPEKFEDIKKSHEARERAYEAFDRNATQENKEKLEATEKKLDQSTGVVMEAEAQKERDIQAEIDRVQELKRELDRPEGAEFEVGPDGKFTDKLLQRAAEKAGIDPASFDASNPEQGDKMFSALKTLRDELKQEIESKPKSTENELLTAPTAKLGG